MAPGNERAASTVGHALGGKVLSAPSLKPTVPTCPSGLSLVDKRKGGHHNYCSETGPQGCPLSIHRLSHNTLLDFEVKRGVQNIRDGLRKSDIVRLQGCGRFIISPRMIQRKTQTHRATVCGILPRLYRCPRRRFAGRKSTL